MHTENKSSKITSDPFLPINARLDFYYNVILQSVIYVLIITVLISVHILTCDDIERIHGSIKDSPGVVFTCNGRRFYHYKVGAS